MGHRSVIFLIIVKVICFAQNYKIFQRKYFRFIELVDFYFFLLYLTLKCYNYQAISKTFIVIKEFFGSILSFVRPACLSNILLKTLFFLGRKYDKYGNYRQWWTNSTIDKFENLTKCFVNQYNNFYIPEIKNYVSFSFSTYLLYIRKRKNNCILQFNIF